jgi:type IV pilus assembly protein PilX
MSNTSFTPRRLRAQQRGISLIVVMIMLSAVFIIVAFGSRLTLLGEKSARNDRDRQIAFQAAEAALSDAEIDLMGPNAATNSRVCAIYSRKFDLFAEGCGNDTTMRGLCSTNTSATTPLYKAIDFEDSSSSRKFVTLGEFTGRNVGFSTGNSALPAQLPRYIVETIPFNIPGSSPNAKAFMVTAIGYGLSQQTQVMLQSVIFKPGLTAGC